MNSFWIAWLVAISTVMLTALMALGQSGTDSGGTSTEKPPIGDFDAGSHQQHEIQIIDERPTIRDFREVPSRIQPTSWDEWHKRLDGAIFQRFSRLAKGPFDRSRPLTAVATFTVTRDGRILNARMVEKSANQFFSAMILTAINFENGSSILQFPAGSERTKLKSKNL